MTSSDLIASQRPYLQILSHGGARASIQTFSPQHVALPNLSPHRAFLTRILGGATRSHLETCSDNLEHELSKEGEACISLPQGYPTCHHSVAPGLAQRTSLVIFPSVNASVHDPWGNQFQCSRATAGASSDRLPSLATRHGNVVSSAMERIMGKRGLREPKQQHVSEHTSHALAEEGKCKS